MEVFGPGLIREKITQIEFWLHLAGVGTPVGHN